MQWAARTPRTPQTARHVLLYAPAHPQRSPAYGPPAWIHQKWQLHSVHEKQLHFLFILITNTTSLFMHLVHTLCVKGHVTRVGQEVFFCSVWPRETCLLVFAVGLLSDVFGLFELDLLDLHLLLILHSPVLNDLHASGWRKRGEKCEHDENQSSTLFNQDR